MNAPVEIGKRKGKKKGIQNCTDDTNRISLSHERKFAKRNTSKERKKDKEIKK